MPVWMAPSVEDQPDVRLYRWRMFQVPGEDGPTNHLVGYVDNREARVCSPIQKAHFLPKEGGYVCLCVTRSGRFYELVGEMQECTPGSPGDSGYLLARWLRINGIDEADVKYIDEISLMV